MSKLEKIITKLALPAGYTAEEIKAGLEFSARKARRKNPPDGFDNAGRFYASERTNAVRNCRAPSRAYPYPEMKSCPHGCTLC